MSLVEFGRLLGCRARKPAKEPRDADGVLVLPLDGGEEPKRLVIAARRVGIGGPRRRLAGKGRRRKRTEDAARIFGHRSSRGSPRADGRQNVPSLGQRLAAGCARAGRPEAAPGGDPRTPHALRKASARGPSPSAPTAPGPADAGRDFRGARFARFVPTVTMRACPQSRAASATP